MNQIRKRLTYANVMSSLAVFLVLGGATAFAATKIGANEIKANSIKTGKIVKEAVTAGKIKSGAVTESRIADGAITTNKLAEKAVTAAKVNVTGFPTVPSATNAQNAQNAVKAQTATKAQTAEESDFAFEAGTALNVLWAVVSNPAGAGNATLVRSSFPPPTVTENVGVDVVFDESVADCAWTATRGATGAGVETAGFAETGGSSGNPNGVDVRTRDAGGTITDGNFHLVVVCP